MSNIFTSLRVTPKKKRVYSSDDDDTVLTPKKLRTMVATPPATPRKLTASAALPPHLARFQSLQSSLHRALSHALATAAVSPSSDTGVVPNVLNNHTLSSTVGLSRTCTLDDLKRLCWLWEWDGKDLPGATGDDDNPFLEGATPKPEQSKQWNRGAMGLVITPTTHLSKTIGRRIPAYGIGIEVEMDIDKDMPGGMAAVARWTAAADQRMKSLNQKLRRWVELHRKSTNVPTVPLADLPSLAQQPAKHSALTQRLVSLSPKSPKFHATPSRSSDPFDYPPSPTRSSPTKPCETPGKRTHREFAIPFPITPASMSRHKSTATASILPQTPSTSRILRTVPSTPRTPQTPAVSSSSFYSRPSTPVNQTGSNADTVPSTPTTSRREALYERIRKRSESQVPATPSKARIVTSTKMSREQLMKLSQEEMRLRCLLGRLGGVAESIWMFFVSPSNPLSVGASPRKRRTIPTDEVVQAIIKSSPVPISSAEALESIQLLTSLCPFFLKNINVGGEEWLEMPASTSAAQPSAPPSPRRKLGANSGDELKTLSPRRVKREEGGLREVRERIKRELDASD
ncbi:hypothetical protein EW145_g579 [Phellinidium pouzarii]|uniref:DNA replication factor Cdt1 C-terminal domain-containing protein n=1 Tax=Phellinidium pouzarii TaxID=167371 RepID=A0A4S4LHR7_9AGAM|nr:hypothetical protein EW145_g579 [Phellinidium pouzarii]